MSVLKFYAEDGKYMHVAAEHLFENKKNWFIGWKCLAGTQSLAIDQNGEVFSANCKSMGIFGKQGSYGNVFTEFHLETAPVNCARRFCETEFDMSIPKYHRVKHQEVISRESTLVDDHGTAVAVAVRGGDDYKRINWNAGNFEQKKLSDWKAAVHRLESFIKGEVCRFSLENPPVSSTDFFDFLKFLVEEKGHLVTLEGSLCSNTEFYLRAMTYADLRLRLDGSEEEFFKALDKIGENFYELQRQRIYCKVHVLIDIHSSSFGHFRGRLIGEPYKNWLEAGFFSEKFDVKEESVAPKIVEAPVVIETPVRTSQNGQRILLFIPMRNCASTIERVIARLDREILENVDEVLILDNDSTDESFAIASKAAKSIQGIKVVVRKNDRNYGFGGSHKLAFQYAHLNKMDYVFIVHGDDSGSPQEMLPVLRSKEFSKYDLVLSDRLSLSGKRKAYPSYRLFSNWMLNLLASVVTTSTVSDFSGGPVNLYRVRTFINKYENPVKQFADRISFAQDALLYVKHRRGMVRFVPIEYREAGGKSFYSAGSQFVQSALKLLSWRFR